MRRDKWLALLRNRISSRKKLRDRASKEAAGSRVKDEQERQSKLLEQAENMWGERVKMGETRVSW